MSADLSAIKAAMTAAGFSPSAGSGWTVSDTKQYLDYCNLHWPVTVETALVGLAYEGVLPDGFPGKEPAPTRTLQSIALTGTATAAVGATSQLTATGTYNIAPLTEDITATATWASSDTTKATVAAGLVTGVAVGSSNITASLDGVTSPADPFTVTAARALQSIAITGANAVAVGSTINLVATGTYNVAPLTADITTQVTWTSSDTTKATVGASTGVVTGVAAGPSNISCSLDGKTAPNHTVTVS